MKCSVRLGKGFHVSIRTAKRLALFILGGGVDQSGNLKFNGKELGDGRQEDRDIGNWLFSSGEGC